MFNNCLKFIWFIFIFCTNFELLAQKELSTGETVESQSTKSNFHKTVDLYNKKEKRPYYILKTSTKGIMYGNACVKEETRKFGFEYLIACNTKPTGQEKVWMYFYNFGTNTVMLFKHGPMWKRNLKRKIAGCRQRTGDFTW